MDCKVTCFDRVMHQVKELPSDCQDTAIEISREDTFIDFLDYCVEKGCFTDAQSTTLYEGIVMWEDLEGNYWEEDYDKLQALYAKVGLTRERFEEYDDMRERELDMASR